MALDVEICSAASIMIGGDTITSFSSNTREAEVCNQIYEITKDMLIAEHPWRFSITQAQLSQLVAEPLFEEYQYAYQLPAGFLRIITPQYGDFKIYGTKLYSNESTLELEYQFNPAEELFPSWFRRVLEFRLAEILAVSVAEDEKKSVLFRGLAEKAVVKARAIDNQSQPNSIFNTTSLTVVRNEG
jgi:hypothetical protein